MGRKKRERMKREKDGGRRGRQVTTITTMMMMIGPFYFEMYIMADKPLNNFYNTHPFMSIQSHYYPLK